MHNILEHDIFVHLELSTHYQKSNIYIEALTPPAPTLLCFSLTFSLLNGHIILNYDRILLVVSKIA